MSAPAAATCAPFAEIANPPAGAPPEEVEVNPSSPLCLSIVYLIAGLALVIVGAEYLASGAIEVARLADISEEVIGLTLVAVGTSLPELVTSVVAALRRHSEIALGNVLGSNVYNVIGIGGLTALVSPIPVSDGMRFFDVPVMLAVSLLLVFVVATGSRVSRWEGGTLLVLYGGYVGFLSQIG